MAKKNGGQKPTMGASRAKKGIYIAICAVATLVLAFCIYKVIDIQLNYGVGKSEYDDMQSDVTATKKEENGTSYLEVDHEALRKVNDWYIGWIEIEKTAISYPMIKYSDNEYFLRRTFEGNSYLGGVIFADYRSAEGFKGGNTVIYGHHMMDGTMFHDLSLFVKEGEEFFENHKEVRIYIDNKVLTYKIFSVFQTDVLDDCYQMHFTDRAQYDGWLANMAVKSCVDTDYDATGSTRIITLSTCTNAQKNTRYVVMAALSQEDEIS
ncbi:MAG: class B sortase [Oscillospiraceae bacterium]